ncbi:FAD-dependent oxidoreductase [Streptomyces sp. NPDC057702]|uniref:FAD-dependent oxidoreductase n=1 Tax=unclassified Streptomyces TaxID=2593676 RepID=UPI0036CA4064
MVRTPPATPPPAASGTDLIVVGGGPAGCAAARMAASVGMRSVLVEPAALCRNLYRVPVLDNVLGGHTNGPALAEILATELADTPLCRLALGHAATRLDASEHHVRVTLDTGTHLSAPYAVVATGVGPLGPGDVDWLTAPPDLSPSPLWEAKADDADGRTLLVLGADRPIGTFLRAHPRLRTRLLVAHPPADDYKAEEVRDDPRVTLLPVRRLTLGPASALTTAQAVDHDGHAHTLTADAVYLSLGSAPVAPPGDLVRAPNGYCPPASQHPRVIVAGDLRSARYQRVMSALGSGAEAALRAYYAIRDLPATD